MCSSGFALPDDTVAGRTFLVDNLEGGPTISGTQHSPTILTIQVGHDTAGIRVARELGAFRAARHTQKTEKRSQNNLTTGH